MHHRRSKNDGNSSPSLLYKLEFLILLGVSISKALKPCLHVQLTSGHKYGSHLRGFVTHDVMCYEGSAMRAELAAARAFGFR